MACYMQKVSICHTTRRKLASERCQERKDISCHQTTVSGCQGTRGKAAKVNPKSEHIMRPEEKENQNTLRHQRKVSTCHTTKGKLAHCTPMDISMCRFVNRKGSVHVMTLKVSKHMLHKPEYDKQMSCHYMYVST